MNTLIYRKVGKSCELAKISTCSMSKKENIGFTCIFIYYLFTYTFLQKEQQNTEYGPPPPSAPVDSYGPPSSGPY